MRYKSLFRVLIKAIGVWMLAQGIVSLVSNFVHIVAYLIEPYSGFIDLDPLSFGLIIALAPALAQFLIGLYLFFGGKWIVDLAIPGNRHYCPECGYDITVSTADNCPECGTPRQHENALL